MSDKEFKSIEEQLDILRNRGLKIIDDEKAKSFLLHNNYYRISGYSLTLRKHDVFSKYATFQNIIDIYGFDQELRHILLKYIEIIEVKFKSIYSYEFTKICGAIGYLNSSNFTNDLKYSEIIHKAEQQKRKRLQHEAYLKHYIVDLKQDIPLWAYVDLMTIADISFLYSISQMKIKKEIASRFGLTMKHSDELLSRFMHSMTIIRNLCAHGCRLYNRLFEQRPSLNRAELSLLYKNSDGTVDNAHLFRFVFIIRRLLSSNNFLDMKSEVIEITHKYPFVRMGYYGFRDDWKEKI